LLQNDIDRVSVELDSEYGWFDDLNDVRQDAMIDISFNLGQTRLRAFKKALAAMDEGDWGEAADQFMDSRWSAQVGNRAKELTEMIRTGEYG
jgi:GH24 family phage-related lysozyme (muramidase)